MLWDIHNGDKPLHIGQRQGEKGGVGGADHQAGVAVLIVARLERQQNHLLSGKPIHGFLPQLGEFIAKALLKAGLIGGQIVADRHGIGVPAAHIVLHEIDDGAVFAADDLRLLHGSPAWQGVDHVVAGSMGRAKNQLVQLVLGFDIGHRTAFFQSRPQILRQDKTVKILIGKHPYCLHSIIIALFYHDKAGGAMNQP